MKEVILETLTDFVKLLPFLFLTYLLMEFIEHRAGEKTEKLVSRAGKAGPVIGSLLGVVPQCGFSAASSGLFSGGLISAGTLIAVFLSTSDEMLPVCISHRVDGFIIAKILVYKVIFGIIVGFAVDSILRISKKNTTKGSIHCLCEEDDCHCEEEGIFRSALHHTFWIALFILIITFALNTVIYFVGEDSLSSLFVNVPVLGCAVAGLVGLVPNCAASVVITELYLSDIISFGALMSGLLAGSGIGILVLFKVNKSLKQNLGILATVYFSAFLIGSLVEFISKFI